jgi:hypothetical protein
MPAFCSSVHSGLLARPTTVSSVVDGGMNGKSLPNSTLAGSAKAASEGSVYRLADMAMSKCGRRNEASTSLGARSARWAPMVGP